MLVQYKISNSSTNQLTYPQRGGSYNRRKNRQSQHTHCSPLKPRPPWMMVEYTSNGIDIETNTKQSFDTSFFSISKRSEPACSEHFIMEDVWTKFVWFLERSKQKRIELVLNFLDRRGWNRCSSKLLGTKNKRTELFRSFLGSKRNEGG